MTRMFLFALPLAALGCLGDDGDKRACNQPSDCLGGGACVDHVCVERDGDDDGGGSGDEGDGDDGPGDDGGEDRGGPGPIEELGEFEDFVTARWTVGDGGFPCDGCFSYAATDLDGGLGCATASAWDATPGRAGSRVITHFDPQDGFDYCAFPRVLPLGSPDDCEADGSGGLRGDCAVYQRWDEDGELVAQRVARGGALTYTPVEHAGGFGCTITVEADFAFAGGGTHRETRTLEFDALAMSPPLCGE